MQPTGNVQVQNGEFPRCAGRDYLETHYHWSTTNHWELTASAKELNDCALQNEKYFKRRFGFDAPREQRCDVLDLKAHLDLTDREVSRLKAAGALTARKGKTTCLCVDMTLFLFGAICLTIVLFWGSILGSALLLSGLPPIKQLLGLTFVGGVSLPLIWAASSISILPLTIVRSRGLRIGEKWHPRENAPLCPGVCSP